MRIATRVEYCTSFSPLFLLLIFDSRKRTEYNSCVNTDEASPQSCGAFKAAAMAVRTCLFSFSCSFVRRCSCADKRFYYAARHGVWFHPLGFQFDKPDLCVLNYSPRIARLHVSHPSFPHALSHRLRRHDNNHDPWNYIWNGYFAPYAFFYQHQRKPECNYEFTEIDLGRRAEGSRLERRGLGRFGGSGGVALESGRGLGLVQGHYLRTGLRWVVVAFLFAILHKFDATSLACGVFGGFLFFWTNRKVGFYTRRLESRIAIYPILRSEQLAKERQKIKPEPKKKKTDFPQVFNLAERPRNPLARATIVLPFFPQPSPHSSLRPSLSPRCDSPPSPLLASPSPSFP